MAGLFCTSCNLETALSPTSPGPFSTVVGAPVINVGAGPAGNNTISLDNAVTVGFGVPKIPSAPVGFAIGFGLSCAAAPVGTPSTGVVCLSIAQNGSSPPFPAQLIITQSGVLSLTVSISAPPFQVVSPAGAFLFNGQRQYIEVYLSGVGAGITATLQVEGTVVGTGVGTSPAGTATYSNFTFGAQHTLAAPWVIDSIYLVNLLGAARNFMLGKRVVVPTISAAVGQFSQYTPNGAPTGYQAVSSIPPAGDTVYASDATLGHQLAVGMSSPVGLSSVDFVMERADARQEVASGGRTVALGIGNGTAVTYGPAQPLTTTYAGLNQVWDVDPTTSASWVLGNIPSRQAAVQTAS